MTVDKEPRRANLATMVGSSLAVVAAGSLLAFSSLAEQAGLEGLATGGLQPTRPGHSAGGAHAITIPAPATDAPRDPRDILAELVRDSRERAPQATTLPPVETSAPETRPAPQPRPERSRPERPRRTDGGSRVAVAQPEVGDAPEADGPPYGHAYGHYKKKHKAPKPARKHAPKADSNDQPVYARSTNDGKAKPPKPSKGPKLEKVKKQKVATPGNGKAKGHSKHGNGNGHSKHAHKGKGKGKGHSKHGG